MMDKIEFARRECRRKGLKYRIKNDALFILTIHPVLSKRYYKQACYNLLNLTPEQITMIIEEGAQ